MRRVLFFETPTFTGATRVTRNIRKIICRHYETESVVVNDIANPEFEIQQAIRKVKPEILFCSFSEINPSVIINGKENGLIVVVRQDYNLRDLSEVQRTRLVKTYPLADWIIVQTPEMKHELYEYEGLRSCKIKVVENPLDEDDILEKANCPNPFPDNGNFHFLWIGRQSDPLKGLPTLHRAFEIVHNQCPQTDITYISDEPNPYKWMKHADCLVISSVSEASPNVLREAVFLGTKVISTDCSPIVRRFLPSENIANVSDSIDLSDKMKYVKNE